MHLCIRWALKKPLTFALKPLWLYFFCGNVLKSLKDLVFRGFCILNTRVQHHLWCSKEKWKSHRFDDRWPLTPAVPRSCASTLRFVSLLRAFDLSCLQPVMCVIRSQTALASFAKESHDLEMLLCLPFPCFYCHFLLFLSLSLCHRSVLLRWNVHAIFYVNKYEYNSKYNYQKISKIMPQWRRSGKNKC